MSKLVVKISDASDGFVVVSSNTGGLFVAKTHEDPPSLYNFDPIGEYALFLLLQDKCRNYSDSIKTQAREAIESALIA